MNLTTRRGEPSREVVKGKLMLNFNMLKRLIMARGKRNYRVSQKKRPHVLNAYNSLKNGTRNKSRVSFKILRKFSF